MTLENRQRSFGLPSPIVRRRHAPIRPGAIGFGYPRNGKPLYLATTRMHLLERMPDHMVPDRRPSTSGLIAECVLPFSMTPDEFLALIHLCWIVLVDGARAERLGRYHRSKLG